MQHFFKHALNFVSIIKKKKKAFIIFFLKKKLTAPSEGIASVCNLTELAAVNINLPNNSGSNVDATTVYSPATFFFLKKKRD